MDQLKTEKLAAFQYNLTEMTTFKFNIVTIWKVNKDFFLYKHLHDAKFILYFIFYNLQF